MTTTLAKVFGRVGPHSVGNHFPVITSGALLCVCSRTKRNIPGLYSLRTFETLQQQQVVVAEDDRKKRDHQTYRALPRTDRIHARHLVRRYLRFLERYRSMIWFGSFVVCATAAAALELFF